MTNEEFQALTAQFVEVAGERQGEISQTIMTMTTDYGERLTEIEDLKTKNAEAELNIANLRKANSDLLINGGGIKPQAKEGNNPNDPTMTNKQRLDSMFDANGILKKRSE